MLRAEINDEGIFAQIKLAAPVSYFTLLIIIVGLFACGLPPSLRKSRTITCFTRSTLDEPVQSTNICVAGQSSEDRSTPTDLNYSVTSDFTQKVIFSLIQNIAFIVVNL